jgi:hypothetical protein
MPVQRITFRWIRVRQIVARLLVLALAASLPRAGAAGESEFGDISVRYSAITTSQLFPAIAQRYGLERSDRNGLVNIAIEHKAGDRTSHMIAADVSGTVADLSGHRRPIRFRETNEDGAIDYLGTFAIDAGGTHVFTIVVNVPGHSQAYTVTFNRDYVLD